MAHFANKNKMISPTRKARVRWQCRRGMLELDLILLTFIEKTLDTLTLTQFDTLEELLAVSDPLLYAWLIGAQDPEDKELLAIVKLIRMHNNAG